MKEMLFSCFRNDDIINLVFWFESWNLWYVGWVLSLSDAIDNWCSLTKFIQLLWHQYKIKCERKLHKKSDWNYYYLHIKCTPLYPHKSTLLILMCVLRMSNHFQIIIRIIIYTHIQNHVIFTKFTNIQNSDIIKNCHIIKTLRKI